ncbi:MAG: Eco57I restriction-modification methylase domain-containing protein [Burkholderiaceae bacterium]|nr:Eco57I restriction-modification methylase domain-containing protein [Burkholderiaceae bacterium]
MLTETAHRAGRAFTATLSRDEQRDLGQFMTPPAIAAFMARRLIANVSDDHVRVLEPAAGAGVLAAAVIEELLARTHKPSHIDLLLYEIDERLAPHLRSLCQQMTEACSKQGVRLDWNVTVGDFLLSDLALDGRPIEGLVVISNPPFFKLAGNDPRAVAHRYAVWGQPNIYSLFMAACARITPPGGRFCFITPRSWMSGAYFQAARQSMLRDLTIDAMHAFESRTDSFEADAVLQETMITWAVGRMTSEPGLPVLLTRSQGVSDIEDAVVQTVPTERIISHDRSSMLSLPGVGGDSFEGWTSTLGSHGLKVSTGPVVAFRASRHLHEAGAGGTVPLLWMQHVGQQAIRWPLGKKREHIAATADSAWMLLPNVPMVLMRRFSPKEAPRRVVCASYEGALPGPVIGLENHLNYIYRPAGKMSVHETRGLSAYLSSRIVDRHLRAFAGTTQVNAVELRELPLPSLERLIAIGMSLGSDPTLDETDRAVEVALGMSAVEECAA